MPASDETAKLTDLVKAYDKRPFIRALVQLIPYGLGSAADTYLATKITNMRQDRARAFYDELSKSNTVLSEDEIASDHFLHAYFSTMRAILNTRRKEKIQLLAQLFIRFCQDKDFERLDAYEENLSILDDLSYREFEILLILYRLEATTFKPGERRTLAKSKKLWPDFIAAIKDKVGIQDDDIPGTLARLNRTGLYQTYIGGYIDYTGDVGYLTPNFYTFLTALNMHEHERKRSEQK